MMFKVEEYFVRDFFNADVDGMGNSESGITVYDRDGELVTEIIGDTLESFENEDGSLDKERLYDYIEDNL